MLRELGKTLMRIEEVQEAILAPLRPIPAEERPLALAGGAVLRADITSSDMITVFFPDAAVLIPVAAATLVLPTPPFPAKNMILIFEPPFPFPFNP